MGYLVNVMPPFFMQKEIFQQLAAVSNTLKWFLIRILCHFDCLVMKLSQFFRKLQVILHLPGISYQTGFVVMYRLEAFPICPVALKLTSECRYWEPIANPDMLVVEISQSGETADTVTAFKICKITDASISLAICNVSESVLIRQEPICVFLFGQGSR